MDNWIPGRLDSPVESILWQGKNTIVTAGFSGKAFSVVITKYGSTQYIWMTQVVLHYAHTFEIFMFDFLFQSDPTFDTSD